MPTVEDRLVALERIIAGLKGPNFSELPAADNAIWFFDGDRLFWIPKVLTAGAGITLTETATAVTLAAGGAMPTPIMITPASVNSIGPEMAAAAYLSPASSGAMAANDAVLVPFTLGESSTVVKLFSFNGTVAAGNIDVGIYNASGALQVSSGTTVMAGTNTLQEYDIPDTVLAAGRYYLAVASSDSTSSLIAWNSPLAVGLDTEQLQSFGLAFSASAFVLPATITLSAIAIDFVPFIGLSLRTLVT